MSGDAALDVISRSTLVHFSDRYFNWPLSTSDVLKLPLRISARAGLDLMVKKPDPSPESFRDFIVSKYGQTLYEIFFRPYTEKFLRWDVNDIHSDWASTGINRSVVDRRVKADSLFDLLRALTLPKKVETRFLYPHDNGFGAFFDRLYALCRATGSLDVLLSDQIARLEDSGAVFDAETAAGHKLRFENLVWSGNVKDLGRLISPDDHNLSYISTVFFNVVCREGSVAHRRAQWIYVSRGDCLISRITCMPEFSRRVCPDGYYNFICEVTDSQESPRYMLQPERYVDGILAEAQQIGFLNSRAGVEAVHVNAVRDTYPIYHRRYRKAYGGIVRAAKTFSKRIHLLGRSGAYWYNNSDHSIRMALDMAEKLIRDPERDFDFRGYFGGASNPEVH